MHETVTKLENYYRLCFSNEHNFRAAKQYFGIEDFMIDDGGGMRKSVSHEQSLIGTQQSTKRCSASTVCYAVLPLGDCTAPVAPCNDVAGASAPPSLRVRKMTSRNGWHSSAHLNHQNASVNSVCPGICPTTRRLHCAGGAMQ